MSFCDNVNLKYTGYRRWGRKVYRLDEPVWFEETRHFVMSVYVRRNYCTDLASVPIFLWWIFPPDGPWMHAAIVHDWLCEKGHSRFMTDAIFRYIMEQDPAVRWWQRLLIYHAVRAYWVLFGWWWNAIFKHEHRC